MRELGTFDKAPCIIIPPGTPVEMLKTYTVLDNQQAGEWDWAMYRVDDLLVDVNVVRRVVYKTMTDLLDSEDEAIVL